MTVECVLRKEIMEYCNCTNTECERRGICCACVVNHKAKGNLPACLRPESD
jgi:hypothetical protein